MSSGDSQEIFKVIFVLGGPGSGKGTQCSYISETYGYVHLSAGELLREERNNESSKLKELINKHIVEGSIVPVEITCCLLNNAMNKSGKKKFLIDGFPRNQNNLDGWNNEMTGKVDVQLVISINCGDETCVERCLSRDSGRVDDNRNTLINRLKQFKDQCVPIIEYYKKKKLVLEIDGGKNKEDVFKDIKNHVDKL